MASLTTAAPIRRNRNERSDVEPGPEDGGGKGIRIERSNGTWSFTTKGEMITKAEEALLMINLDGDAFVNVARDVGERNITQELFDGWVPPVADLLENLWSMFVDAAEEPGRFYRQDIFGIVGIAGALFNRYSISQINERIDADERRATQTVHELDLVEHTLRETVKDIEIMNDKFHAIEEWAQKQELKLKFLKWWSDLQMKIWAFWETAIAALDHRLSPEVLRFTNMEEMWGKFQEQLRSDGWTPQITNLMHVFQLKVDVHVRHDGRVMLVVPIPITRGEQPTFTIKAITRRPIWIGENLVEVITTEDYLAVDENSRATIPLTEAEFQGCLHFGMAYHCPNSISRNMEAAGSCTKSIWAQDWEVVKERCAMVKKPIESGIWSLGNNAFQAVVESDTTLIVRCVGEVESPVNIDRGMWKIQMEEGCEMTSDVFTAHTTSHVTETMEIDWRPEEVFDANTTAKHFGEEVGQAASLFLADLEETKNSHDHWNHSKVWGGASIGMTGLIFLILVIVLTAMYLRARKFWGRQLRQLNEQIELKELNGRAVNE